MSATPRADQLIPNVEFLLESATARGTTQGVEVYRLALAALRANPSSDQLAHTVNGLKAFLIGAEAHGHFTDREGSVVKSLWEALESILGVEKQ